jgi:hypothetical protein
VEVGEVILFLELLLYLLPMAAAVEEQANPFSPIVWEVEVVPAIPFESLFLVVAEEVVVVISF